MATQDSAVTLDILGMTCASCVRRVERALGKVEGVETANVNFATETARVQLGRDVSLEKLMAAVAKAGYTASPHKEGVARSAGTSQRTLWMLIAGAVLGVPAVIIAMAMDIADLTTFGDHQDTGWVVLALVTPIQFGLGWRFYRGAWTSIRHLNPNMDVLVAIGTTVAYAYSVVIVVSGSHRHMFFDVSAAVLVFITMGKYLEEQSKGAASSALTSLLGMAAKNATVIRDGAEVEVAVDAVRAGDILAVRPGQRVPVDAVITEGHGAIDESMVTGESLPVERRPGDAVLGGTIVEDGVLRLRATAVGADMALRRLARMVEEAQGSKAPIQKLVDQVAAIFVPVVLVIAAATVLGWGLIDGSWVDGMRAAVAVLVVACPCALGLATPTAIMVGTGLGAERGILIRDAEVLERIKKLDVVVLDKTGTLTEGRPQVTGVVTLGEIDEDELLRLAAAAETASDHPLSRAVVDAAVDRGFEPMEASDLASITARGVSATVDGKPVIGGNRALMADRGVAVSVAAHERSRALEAEGRTAIFIAVDGELAGLIAIADEVKAAAPRAVASLKELGLRVVMLTGDAEGPASRIAAQVGVTEYRAGVMPEDKLAFVREMQAQGLSVAMVGDGINDAPALAAADIGVAMSTGTDTAIEAAGITLLHGDVSKLAEAILLGRGTLRTIRQNLVWAFGYNVVAIPIAVVGLLNPIIAGAAMALSSVSVMANSLRLRSQARRVAERSGNRYVPPAGNALQANRAPLLALGAAVVVLVLPLVAFTAIDRGWFEGGSDGDGAAGHGEDHVRVDLGNWYVETSAASAPAGRTTFRAVHVDDHAHGGHESEGGETHELVVARRLPDGGYEIVGRTEVIDVGESADLTLELVPGEYELQCTITEEVDGRVISHYVEGMRQAFTVS